MRSSIVALVLLSLGLPAFAAKRQKGNPWDMRSRFKHAVRFHEKGLAQLEAAHGRIAVNSSAHLAVSPLYHQLKTTHQTGLIVAKEGLQRATKRGPIPLPEDSHREAQARMNGIASSWRAVSSVKRDVEQLGHAINASR
jgi:hypothetical protein